MSAVDPSVSENEQMPPPAAKGPDLPDRLWTYDDFKAVEAMPVDFTTGLASLAFIRAAIRRSARFCAAFAAVGLLIGLGMYVAFPPSYKASTSVLVTYGPYENVSSAPADNQAIVQSRAVAALAMRKLGLHEDAGSFLAAYTATATSNRVLEITAKAPTSTEAMNWANAVAAAFLRFRDGQLEAEQNIALAAVKQQVNAAKQRVDSLNRQISSVLAQGPVPGQQTTLSRLRAEQGASVQRTVADRAIRRSEPDPHCHHARHQGERGARPCHPGVAFTAEVHDLLCRHRAHPGRRAGRGDRRDPGARLRPPAPP